MRSLVIMEQGLTVGVQGECLAVMREGETIETVRIEELSEVLLFGGVMLTPSAIATLLAKSVDTVFLSAKGSYRGRLMGPLSKHVELRMAQYDMLRRPEVALALARSIVVGKIQNQRNLMLRAQREHKNEALAAAIGAMRRAAESAVGAQSLDSLRGYEGAASAAYFGSFGLMIRNPAFSFTGRNRRPPRDPVNAMLSFGYTLLSTLMDSLVRRAGLDPMLGVYHQADYGRPSMALDLVEEFRPVIVDSLVLRVVNRREVSSEDFEDPGEEVDAVWTEAPGEKQEQGKPRAVWLGETGRRVFFRAWSRRLHETMLYEGTGEVRSLEDIALHQVYCMARALRGECEYTPFVPR